MSHFLFFCFRDLGCRVTVLLVGANRLWIGARTLLVPPFFPSLPILPLAVFSIFFRACGVLFHLSVTRFGWSAFDSYPPALPASLSLPFFYLSSKTSICSFQKAVDPVVIALAGFVRLTPGIFGTRPYDCLCFLLPVFLLP